MINYEEITLAQVENLFNIFNFECSGDEQKIRLGYKKAFYELIKSLNIITKAFLKTMDILEKNIPIYEDYVNGKVLDIEYYKNYLKHYKQKENQQKSYNREIL